MSAEILQLYLLLFVKGGKLLELPFLTMNHQIQWIIPAARQNKKNSECVKARTSQLLRDRQTGQQCLEASGVFSWRKLQSDSSVSFRVKTKTFEVYSSQLENISYLLSLMLQAQFTFSWVRPLGCSSGNLSPTPPPDLDLGSNKTCWVVALDK